MKFIVLVLGTDWTWDGANEIGYEMVAGVHGPFETKEAATEYGQKYFSKGDGHRVEPLEFRT